MNEIQAFRYEVISKLKKKLMNFKFYFFDNQIKFIY